MYSIPTGSKAIGSPNPYKLLVVKIAVHGQRRRCVERDPVWLRRHQQRRQCQAFLRAHYITGFIHVLQIIRLSM